LGEKRWLGGIDPVRKIRAMAGLAGRAASQSELPLV
jgi:hypothetical protein